MKPSSLKMRARLIFMREAGMSTLSNRACPALRIRVNISAMGSVMLILSPHLYQLDLITPGISPFRAMLRKQMRQMPNRRKKARGRPHTGQRLYFWTGNLVGRFALAINDFLAINLSVKAGSLPLPLDYFRKGNPNNFNKYFPSSSVG